MYDLIVIGGGPAGVAAALRAREQGAAVAVVEKSQLRSVPTHVLPQVARLARDYNQVANYRLEAAASQAPFVEVFKRAQTVVSEAHEKKQLRGHLQAMGVEVFDQSGAASFVDSRRIRLGDGRELAAHRFALGVGGYARQFASVLDASGIQGMIVDRSPRPSAEENRQVSQTVAAESGMKKIYLIGFRGTGFRDAKFSREPGLIRAGHAAIAFEGAEDRILGFHPSPEAVEAAGGEEAAIAWLKAKKTLNGTLQEDYSIFARAAELARQDTRTAVWELAVAVPDEAFERIRQQAITWYTEKQVFAYAFPPDEPMPDRDNCATFPRRLGLPPLDPIGQIKDYVRVLATQGEPWEPKGV